ncbi:hypothetical protein A2U01_0086422, partial [Trifolium medium]|nr:hypothetical protein [Trifolium medium]
VFSGSHRSNSLPDPTYELDRTPSGSRFDLFNRPVRFLKHCSPPPSFTHPHHHDITPPSPPIDVPPPPILTQFHLLYLAGRTI